MVEHAWEHHCNANAGVDQTRCKKHPRCRTCGYCTWYEAELAAAVLLPTSVYCDQKRDFEKAIAHFEAAAGGGKGKNPFYWNHRLYGADARRIIHNIQAIARDFECDEHYLQGIARQALKLSILPPLETLTYDQLIIVLRAIKIEISRQQRRGETPSVPAPKVDEPF